MKEQRKNNPKPWTPEVALHHAGVLLVIMGKPVAAVLVLCVCGVNSVRDVFAASELDCLSVLLWLHRDAPACPLHDVVTSSKGLLDSTVLERAPRLCCGVAQFGRLLEESKQSDGGMELKDCIADKLFIKAIVPDCG